MNNKNSTHSSRKATFFTALVLLALVGTTATAQGVRGIAGQSLSTSLEPSAPAPPKPASQNVNASLASLPEADTLLFISPHLIITEAAARVLPEKDLAGMREGLSEMKKNFGLDPGNIDYIVLQVRFKKPNANLDFSLPEYMLVASGDFSAEALIQFARIATNDKLRDEKYGSKTLGVFTIDELAKQAEKTPLLKSLAEIAIAPVNGNTIAIGSTSYVKAAIDAAEGKGRISPDLLNSVMRDPTALISVAGSPWTAFAKTFALLGTENNPRAARCDSRLGDFYAAITMEPSSFKFRGAMNADNPDTAKIMKSLLSMALLQAAGFTSDKSAQAILKSLVITPTETEVLVQADVSQQAVADFIREQTTPKKESASSTDTKPKEATKPTQRRRHRTTKTTKKSGT